MSENNTLTLGPEQMGPAETLIQTILTYADHMYHGRPGIIRFDSSNTGTKWDPVSHSSVNGEKVVFLEQKMGNKKVKTKLGILASNGKDVMSGSSKIGEYRNPGLYLEVVAWTYEQIAKVYKMNNELVARWASYAFNEDHRDLKVVLAAFLLCQTRKGDPITEDGKVLFYDNDYRDVGEAMCLCFGKNIKDISPKHLLRIRDVLMLPQVAKINRDLGFGKSERKPFLGRWPKVVEKWLSFREGNPKLLEGLVQAAFKSTVKDLARSIGYKPSSPKFFQTLRWKQVQAKDGRRSLAIGEAVAKAESLEGLTEEQICQKIVETKPNYKRLVGLLPQGVKLTAAMLAAAIEAKCLSDKDLIIYSPSLEELGLLKDENIRARWESALKSKEINDTRAANIAKNLKNEKNKDAALASADAVMQKTMADKVRNLRIYVVVDKSGSMSGAIEKAVEYTTKLVTAFGLDKVHVSVFDNQGYQIKIQHASAAGVKNAFAGITANGGTNYNSGVRVLSEFKPKTDEDALFFFIGDEEDGHINFKSAFDSANISPVAFLLTRVLGSMSNGRGMIVRNTASIMNIPCIMVDEKIFGDVYSLPRTLSQAIDSTPVSTNVSLSTTSIRRESLVDKILKQPLLKLPVWA